MAFGAGDYAHDVRLACHGLDRDDNDFVIGLIGKDLFPLSALVQAMRKTQQTALYLDRLGPFFVGRAIWQSRRIAFASAGRSERLLGERHDSTSSVRPAHRSVRSPRLGWAGYHLGSIGIRP